jgi:hypothetical protein
MIKLAIIHFQPIELYPPIINFLNYLTDKRDNNLEVYVYTTASTYLPLYYSHSTDQIKIIRAGNVKKQPSFFRYYNYCIFYTSTTVKLLASKPDIIFYYETLSVLPAYLYKKILKLPSRLLIHYHEYTSAEEYKKGMTLGRWLHKLEKKIYNDCIWISHTNTDRMNFFLADNPNVPKDAISIMPNYPPSSWKRERQKDQLKDPVRFVHVGALSLDTMYTKEFVDWIINNEGKVTWDIYSTNITDEAKSYLLSLKKPNIRFNGGISYDSIPDVLKNYDIGIILYKGHIPNYVYNAPNKLFEYWACNLDVWFPDNMVSSLPFATKYCYPQIIPVDFNNPGQLVLESITKRSLLSYKPSHYYCEKIFDLLFEHGIMGKSYK